MNVREYRAVAHLLTMRKKRVTPEGALKAAVGKLLTCLPQVAWFCRMNVGAVKFGDGEQGRWVKFGYPGMADYYVRLKSQPGMPATTLWLELKAGTAQTSAQKTFQLMVESIGDRYRIVRSIEEAEMAIRMYGCGL